MVNGYKGDERRSLSDEDIHRIAKEAKNLALEEIYAEIGRGVVKRILWLLGLGASALAAWLTYKGYNK